MRSDAKIIKSMAGTEQYDFNEKKIRKAFLPQIQHVAAFSQLPWRLREAACGGREPTTERVMGFIVNCSFWEIFSQNREWMIKKQQQQKSIGQTFLP